MMLYAPKSENLTKQLHELKSLIIALFSPKNPFNFVANYSLEECVACLQKEVQKPPSNNLENWFFSAPKTTVDTQQYSPYKTEFWLHITRTGRYSFEVNFHGYFETQDETSTLVKGQSSRSGFIASMVICVFFVLWGMSAYRIGTLLFLNLVGLCYGPISNFLIKKKHQRYIKSIFATDPVQDSP